MSYGRQHTTCPTALKKQKRKRTRSSRDDEIHFWEERSASSSAALQGYTMSRSYRETGCTHVPQERTHIFALAFQLSMSLAGRSSHLIGQ